MAYIDSNFLVSNQECVAGTPAAGVGLGTVTASATQTYTGTAGSQVNGTLRFPVFKNPVKIENIRVYCTGAAGGGVSGLFVGFYNGANGAIANGTLPAAGTWADFTPAAAVLDSHGVIVTSSSPAYFTTTNGEVTMLTIAIGTASASSLGSYAVDFTVRNLFVS